MAMKTRKAPAPSRASREQLDSFLDNLRQQQAPTGEAADSLRSATLRHLSQYNGDELTSILGRAYLDMPKSASQKLGKMPTKRSGEPLAESKPPETPTKRPATRRPRKAKPKS